jgi:hypothetical protein
MTTPNPRDGVDEVLSDDVQPEDLIGKRFRASPTPSPAARYTLGYTLEDDEEYPGDAYDEVSGK